MPMNMYIISNKVYQYSFYKTKKGASAPFLLELLGIIFFIM